MSILRGVLGIVVLLGICYLLSSNRRNINWRLVGVGMAMQIILAVLILKVPFVRQIFDYISSFFVVLLDFTEEGAKFVLGDWPNVTEVRDGITGDLYMVGNIFAFKILPTIIFFSALSALLYYLGILQLIIKGFAWVMYRTMGLTGAESLA
ncbi:MAG: Na+ dependent nucleoside transporter, partial [Lewinella sp.]|nr:Na+ dependent nucleoside transporter [Lewinella sp.]